MYILAFEWEIHGLPNMRHVVACSFWWPVFQLAEKWLQAITRSGMRHKREAQSHVSMVISVRSLLAKSMGIWRHESGPFQPNFTVFAILGHVGNTISAWAKGPSQK